MGLQPIRCAVWIMKHSELPDGWYGSRMLFGKNGTVRGGLKMPVFGSRFPPVLWRSIVMSKLGHFRCPTVRS